MPELGTKVQWKDQNVFREGTVIDYYQFTSSLYYERHGSAILIRCSDDGKCVLKLKNELNYLN